MMHGHKSLKHIITFHLDSIRYSPLLVIFFLTHMTVTLNLTCNKEPVKRIKIPVEAKVLIFLSTQKL